MFGVCLFFGGFWCIEKLGLPREKKIIGGKTWAGPPIFASHKYAGKSALRYELGVDTLSGNLVWIHGPYPAGKYADIKIFNKVLCNFLEPGERGVEADEGYRGHPDKINVRE